MDTNVILPSGPTVTVHKSWRVAGKSRGHLNRDEHEGRFKKSHPIASTGSGGIDAGIRKRPEQKKYQFINASKPGQRQDIEAQTLVRSHARNHGVRENRWKRVITLNRPSTKGSSIADESDYPKEGNSATSDGSDPRHVPHRVTTPIQIKDVDIPQPFGFASAFSISEYPIKMQPRTHKLLSRYLTQVAGRMYPLEKHLRFNPLKSPEWFQFAVGDAAMFHAVLYAGAVYLAPLEGKTESEDTVYHLNQTISIVNKRLSEQRTFGEAEPRFQDSIIAAISCLALGEAVTGNLNLWHVHMRGLKQMIRLRGSMTRLGIMLQMKLRRSDIVGAIDHASSPYLGFNHSQKAHVWSVLPLQQISTTRTDIARLLRESEVNEDVMTTMSDLALFSQAIRCTKEKPLVLLDPIEFSEDMYWIEYRLLSFPSSLSEPAEEHAIDKASRAAGLLYMKLIIDEFPHSATGSSILLRTLQDSLLEVPVVESNAPMLLWLSLVGAALSKTWIRRKSFIAHLVYTANIMRVSSLNDTILVIFKELCSEDVFGNGWWPIWEEVTIAMLSSESSGMDGELF